MTEAEKAEASIAPGLKQEDTIRLLAEAMSALELRIMVAEMRLELLERKGPSETETPEDPETLE